MGRHRETVARDIGAVRLFVVSCFVYFAGRSPYLGQWDSFDYLKQVVTHRLSDLGFGRPIFLGYNIVLWEATKKAFDLDPLAVGGIVQAATILLGGVGVVLFHRLAAALLDPRAARMAAIAFLLSPVYALYAGYVMTEVPMLVALIGGAAVLADRGRGERTAQRDVAGGILFGLAVGIREQAVVWGAGYLWLLWISRPERGERLRSIVRFGLAAGIVSLAPVAVLYASDTAAFADRMRVWLRAIPTGSSQIPANAAASLLYLFVASPAAWLAAAGALAFRRARRVPAEATGAPGAASTVWGAVLGLALPVAALWRDADVQIHPRYLLIALPQAVLLCAALVRRFTPSVRAAMVWSIVHIALFGASQLGIQRLRDLQWERRAYAERVYETLEPEALIVAGGYSPIFDYYRVVGGRGGWEIVWSGWNWDKETVRGQIERAITRGLPVYLCDGPAAWLNFEAERLDLHTLIRNRPKESVFPGLTRLLRWPRRM